MAVGGGYPWTDEELRVAVEAYLYLLRLEMSGVQCRERAADTILRATLLQNRNEASRRFRMRNISAVAQELGGPILQAYSPAQQVGVHVRARVTEMLKGHPTFAQLLGAAKQTRSRPISENREELLTKLENLKDQLADLERTVAGIGHNQPPDTIDGGLLSRMDVAQAKKEVIELQTELAQPLPNPKVVVDQSRKILGFGMKLAVWVGDRGTVFADAALKTAAPIAVAAAAGILPTLIDAIASIGQIVAKL